MPNNSVKPEINFCASVLAKAFRQEDSDAFSLCHDALGKIFNPETLKEVEELAHKFTSLPTPSLESKINWLRSHGVEPIDVDAVFEKTKSATKSVSEVKKVELEVKCDASCEIDDKSTAKKRNRSKKKKKPVEESQNKAESVKLTAEEEISAIVAAVEKAGEAPSSKRKKKKKKKTKKATPEASDQPQPQTQEAIAIKSQKTDDCKSPVETPMFDSGIGSCVASGGEDKSSVLSGSTIESIGENTELVTERFNFTFNLDDNVILEHLNSNEIYKKVSNGAGKRRNESEASNVVEMTFGAAYFPTTEGNISKEARKPIKNLKPSVFKTENEAKNTEYEITFKLPQIEDKITAFPQFRDVEARGDFDHAGAIQFLTDEWNKSLQNPSVQWRE